MKDDSIFLIVNKIRVFLVFPPNGRLGKNAKWEISTSIEGEGMPGLVNRNEPEWNFDFNKVPDSDAGWGTAPL